MKTGTANALEHVNGEISRNKWNLN